MNTDWVTPKQAAEMTGFERNTILRWIKLGKLEANRISRKTIRVSVASIERLMKTGKR